ncbi:hypothetical protein [Alcaligenes parafaecalis]|uniref:Acid-shock protein n=1 Tax=Alcaligenes parafaecalis TaxID=171260 RepID=A0ABT3VHS5_9BURK|nr:hypothetical protein [Alcaligenes parafaecalis]MCX5462770.1 hypothetical protein [Alcaligenes parafaecalis]
MKRSTLIWTVLLGTTGVLAGTTVMAQKPAPVSHAAVHPAATTAPKAKAPVAPKAAGTAIHAPAKQTKRS